MTARNFATWFAGCLLIAAAPASALAQQEFAAPVVHGDSAFFAPVDFTFEGLPIEHRDAWFFRYDKLSWDVTGERVVVGVEYATDDGSLAPFRNFVSGRAGDVGFNPNLLTPVLTTPPQQISGLQSSHPRSHFGWGERYEAGYTDGETGWTIGVLDGPDARSGQNYGMLTEDPLYGSVYIVFDDPQNLMFGFLDVVDGSGGAFQPDGLGDDIDGDGQYGYDGYDTQDPGRVPDVIFGPNPRGDWDDLVRLPTSWRFVDVRNSSETQGVELMRTVVLNNNHYMAKHQNNRVELSWGVRYLRLRDEFVVNGFGGVMGRSSWNTEIFNNIVGPQFGAKWIHQRHRLRFDGSGRILLGANIENFTQEVSLGEDLVPGQLNRALYFAPTVTSHGKREVDFSPTAELRLQASYQVTRALAVQLGYTAVYVDSISRAVSQVRYTLPNMGFRDRQAGEQEIFINGVNFGFEAKY